MYLFGGECELPDGTTFRMETVEHFRNSSSSMQAALANESACRVSGAAAGLDQSIYIMGGALKGHDWLDSCVRFDVDTPAYHQVCLLAVVRP
jgi:hypothetical protein